MDLQNNASFSTAFSEQCEAKLVHVVLLLYLAVSSALAIGSDKRAALS